MQLSQASIYDDILDLIRSRENVSDTRFIYKLEIITPKTSVVCSRVWTHDITRDFISRYSDYLTLVVSMSRYDYDELIFPHRSDLLGSLSIEAVDEKTGKSSGNKTFQQFRVKLLGASDDKLRYGDTLAETESDKNQDLKEFGVQLLSLDLEQMRLIDVSGTIRDTTPRDVLEVMLASAIPTADAYPRLSKFYEEVEDEPYDGRPVDVHLPDRQDPIGQQLVPDGIKLDEFPAWLQKHGGGVYKYNLGFYCLAEWAYVYPLFNTESYVDRRKITIVSVGPGKFDGIDKTYKIETGKVSILSTGQVASEDNTDADEFNYGNGVRFALPNFNDTDVSHVDGVSNFDGSYQSHGDNKPGLNNTQVHNRITANSFYEISRIAANRGTRASFIWENANPSVILPNTEVRVLYKSGSQVYERTGIVIGFDYQSQALENDATHSHQGQGVIHCFLKL